MWGIKGIRRIVKVKIGYENFYVYSAVCPATGEDFTLLLPYVNTRVMNRSLAEFGTWLEGRKCILVMDQAGWHCSKELRVPSNVEIAHLPPYSPELNPVERLWDWLKRNAIRNRFFDTLVEIMDAADEQIRMLTPEILKSMCACEYLAH
jgi:transposase